MKVEAARKIVKEEFEAKKKEILDALPETNKSVFGRVGLGKRKGDEEWLPCLFLGPFDLGPNSPMRQLWLEMLVSAAGKRN